MTLSITATVETWPIAGAFVIARGAKREATVVVAHVSDGTVSGRGECVPYARYGETVDSVQRAILGMQGVALGPREPAGAVAGRCRPQRARLCAVGLRGQAQRHQRRPARRVGTVAASPHRLHHQPGQRGGYGRQRRPSCTLHAAAETEAGRARAMPSACAASGRHAHTRASSPMPTSPGHRPCCPS